MSEDDDPLARLPTGNAGWQRFAEYVRRLDDSYERYFLELKSDVDLNTDAGRAKVAKFILGAANRIKREAMRKLEGRALLVLGIGVPGGVPPFEANELDRVVQKFAGKPGPMWDHHRIPDPAKGDLVVVIVEPPEPEHQPWVCLADGPEKLFEGRFYIRGDGDTRQARAPEIQELLRQTRSYQPSPDLAVELVGAAQGYVCDPSVLDEYIARERERLLVAYPKPVAKPTMKDLSSLKSAGMSPSIIDAMQAAQQVQADIARIQQESSVTRSFLSGLHHMRKDERSLEQYTQEIDDWETECRNSWAEELEQCVAALWPSVAIRVTNLSVVPLEDVEVELHIEGDVEGVERVSRSRFRPGGLLPSLPRAWGPIEENFSSPLARGIPSPAIYMPSDLAAGGDSGRIHFRNSGSVDVEVRFDRINPVSTVESDADDLILIVRDDEVRQTHGTWRAFPRGQSGVLSGSFTVDVEPPRDLSQLYRDVLIGVKREDDD